MSVFGGGGPFSDTTCSDVTITVCEFKFHNFIIAIEYISLFLLISLLLFYILYFISHKHKFKNKLLKFKKIKKIPYSRIILFGFVTIFLFFTTFLYTFLDLIIPGNYFKECYGKTETRCTKISERPVFHKPIIYFYPEKVQDIKVKLEVEGKLIADYPEYNEEIDGWDITAYPDGKVIENGEEYSYIFWEAEAYNNNWDLSKGFVVAGEDSREFLKEKLSYLGLTPKEYNEFIVYWYPLMMNNKYNLVYFAGEDYTSKAPLEITPKPDSVLRVFTVIKPLEEKIEIEEQVLEKFERKGFSVVEWGGTILE